MQVASHRVRLSLEELHQIAMARRWTSTLSTLSRSPMWGLITTSRPRLSATVFFRCPPTARIVGSRAGQSDRQRGVAAGTAKDLQAPAADPGHRIVDRADDRPVVRQDHGRRSAPAARGRRRSRSPSALRRGCRWCRRRPARTASISRWCSGVQGSITPRYGLPGATRVGNVRGAVRRPFCGAAAGSARLGDASSAASRGRHSQTARQRRRRSRIMTANGLSGRCFRWRSRCDGCLALVASTSSWNPPSPFRATICPPQEGFGRRAQGVVGRPPIRRRPASSSCKLRAALAGRRSAGRGTAGRSGPRTPAGSRAHRESGHRGPRAVVGQLPDDRPPRPAVRAVGKRIAAAALVGICGFPRGIRRRWPGRRAPSGWERCPGRWCESESRVPERHQGRGVPRRSAGRYRACGGGVFRKPSRNAWICGGGPSSSIRTASTSLRTQPLRPRLCARLNTYGRNPTPWTTPWTETATRCRAADCEGWERPFAADDAGMWL